MNLRDISLAFERPHHLSPVSAWVEHIPFALALVQLLRPRTIVELGTHMGDSYCAFCQAVQALQLPTRCTAVDTWRGDPHAGAYAGRLLDDLRAYHDPRYGRFSRLLQARFDDAVAEFPDRSIDLLHLDGLHTYDAVRHDVDTWLPKLSDSGVLLLHDTQVLREDFGVHRLWAELRERFPHFEFLHGYGLGVLAVGPALPAPFLDLLQEAQSPAGPVQSLFQTLGNRIQLGRGVRDLIESARSLAIPVDALGIDLALSPSTLPLPSAVDPLDNQSADLKQWLDEFQIGLGALGATLSRTRHALRRESASAPPPAAALALYWPDAAGNYHADRMGVAYVPADGRPHEIALRFQLDLPPSAAVGGVSAGGGLRIRIDPGDRPAFWSLRGLSLIPHQLVDSAGARRASPVASPLRPSQARPIDGVVELTPSPGLDTSGTHHYVLFSHTSDPRLELLVTEGLPADVSGVWELRATCCVLDAFGAYAASDPPGLAVAAALAARLTPVALPEFHQARV